MENTIRRLLRNKFDEKLDFTNPVNGILGDETGVVEIPDKPGYVYVRVRDTVIEVANLRCAALPGVEVWVGIDPLEPNIAQVLDYKASALSNQPEIAGLVKLHGKEHTWGGNDPSPIWNLQILDGRVTAYQDLSVIVYPIMVNIPSVGWTMVDELTPRDLTASVPAATYSRWVLVSIAADGTFAYTNGTAVLTTAFTMLDIPAAPAGTLKVLAAVRLYGGQTVLYETLDGSDILDLRADTSTTASAAAVPWTGITGKPSVFPPSAHQHAGTDITSAVANATDADTLDGNHASAFAPIAPTFVTLSTNATLPNERVLTAGAGITLTDGGAGNALIIESSGGTPNAPDHVFSEDHSGECNDVAVTFITVLEFQPETTAVYINGLRQRLNVDYTEATTYDAVTLTTAAATGDALVIDYTANTDLAVVITVDRLLEDGTTRLMENGSARLLE